MKHRFTPTILAKLSGVCLLFLFMVVIVACGSSTSGQALPGTPVATITINLGQYFGSPTSALHSVYCGGWATDATTPYSPTGVVNVYGKFTQTDSNGNPVGVDGATATATISWPDGSRDSIQVLTTSDGLAVFTIPLQASAINHIVLIRISFVKGNLSCTIPQQAFFTAILLTPTPSGSVSPSPSGSPNGSATPSLTPTVSGTPTSSPSPTPTLPLPSPTPTKTPHR